MISELDQLIADDVGAGEQRAFAQSQFAARPDRPRVQPRPYENASVGASIPFEHASRHRGDDADGVVRGQVEGARNVHLRVE